MGAQFQHGLVVGAAHSLGVDVEGLGHIRHVHIALVKQGENQLLARREQILGKLQRLGVHIDDRQQALGHVTRERIRQIEARALMKLREQSPDGRLAAFAQG